MAGINLWALNLFVTSQCNSFCPNCFYRRNLNRKDDLNFSHFKALSQSLGKVKVLNISGGEPFLQEDLPKICQLFSKNNQTISFSIPTNGLLPKVITKQTEKILKIVSGKRVVICLSCDGTSQVHDQLRGRKGSFKKVVESCKELIKLRKKYPRLVIRIATVVFQKNYQDLFNLFNQAPDFFPEIEALNLSLGRPEKFGDKQLLPSGERLKRLFLYKQKVVDKNRPFWRRLLERVIFVATMESIQKQKQSIRCQAGRRQAVIFANGDVGLCEMLPTVGNIKRGSLSTVWQSRKARKRREEIGDNRCFCTHEGFLFHSLLASPLAWPRLVFKSLTLK